MVEGIRLVKFPKKIRDTTSQKNPTSLIKKTACTVSKGSRGISETIRFIVHFEGINEFWRLRASTYFDEPLFLRFARISEHCMC